MPVCKLIIFDMDGTLTIPQTWMFKEMRKSVDLPLDSKKDLLVYINEEITDKDLQKKYHDNIKEIETRAMLTQEPQPGLNELFRFLQKTNISKNLVTRNLIEPVTSFIHKFVETDVNHFDIILTRAFEPPKPSPKPLLHIVENVVLRQDIRGIKSLKNGNSEHPHESVDHKEFFMVGDSYDDMKSGRDAGFTTILVVNPVNREKLLNNKDAVHLIDYTINNLTEIIHIIESSKL